MSVEFITTATTSKGLHVTLRDPQAGDLDAMWTFINTLSRERTYLFIQDVEISLEYEQEYLDRVLKEVAEHKGVQINAFSGSTLIGNASITLEGGAANHTGSLGIAVAAPYRGQGVGELLMQTVYDQAVARLPGLSMVTLSVFGNNPIAINLYRKMGYIEYGRLPDGFRHREQFVDRVEMYKVVAQTTNR
ncbi:MAG: GNAT family N-acetyltransferase [Anaerolineae bacterium]|nr:GNAT family N-acetyltransferase [Anaerolineae bacterium]